MDVTVLVNRSAGTVIKRKITAESLREMFQKAGTRADVQLIPGDQILEVAVDPLDRYCSPFGRRQRVVAVLNNV